MSAGQRLEAVSRAVVIDRAPGWALVLTPDGAALTLNRDMPRAWVIRDESGRPTHPEPFLTRADALDALERGDA